MNNCLNCGFSFSSTAIFCSNCGQKTNTHRLKMHDIWHDALHAFTHTDKGIFVLISKLLINPALVIKEYTAGKRKKYFSPFTFLLIIVGMATFAMSISGFINQNPAYNAVPKNPITHFLDKHVNIVILLNVPILAFFQTLFFKKHYNYAENLVAAAYVSAIRSIFFTVIIAPLWMYLHNYYYQILIAYIVVWAIFYAWVCTQLFVGKPFVTFCKGILVPVCTQLVYIGIISIAFAIYFSLFYKK